MLVFNGSYNHRMGWGAYEEKEVVVVANTQNEAFGLCLIAYPETKAEHWSFCEIPTDKAEVHPISSAES